MIITLKSVKEKAFTGDDGTSRPYFWYKGERHDGITIQLGSTQGDLPLNVKTDLPIEKYEKRDGSFGYRLSGQTA